MKINRLKIEFTHGDDPNTDVSIQYVNVNEAILNYDDEAVSDETFLEHQERFQAICNGIHALVAELGPLPDTGWEIKFWVE